MRRRLRGEAGTSLIEVLVAVVTFLVVVLGLGTSIISARRTGDSSRQLAEATTLGLDKLEHLRTLLLVAPELAPGNHTDPANPLRPDGTAGGIFNRSWKIDSDLPLIGMRQIEMTVSWNDRGRTQSIKLVTSLSLI